MDESRVTHELRTLHYRCQQLQTELWAEQDHTRFLRNLLALKPYALPKEGSDGVSDLRAVGG